MELVVRSVIYWPLPWQQDLPNNQFENNFSAMTRTLKKMDPCQEKPNNVDRVYMQRLRMIPYPWTVPDPSLEPSRFPGRCPTVNLKMESDIGKKLTIWICMVFYVYICLFMFTLKYTGF